MKNTKHLIQVALATSVAFSLFAACAPTTQNPVTPSQVVTNPGQPSGTAVNTPAKSTLAGTMQAELLAVHEDEALYADAVSAATDTGFSVKALNIPARGDISAMVGTGLSRPVSATAGTALARARLALGRDKAKEARERVRAKLATKREHLQTLRAQFQATGAVTVNEDGTITIDPAKFKATAKAAMEKKKADIEARLAKVKDKLAATKEVAKDKVEKMRRKNNVVRTSEKTSVTNDDGSVTETVKVSFENTRIGLKRNTFIARTTKNGKLVSLDFKLEATHKNFTRTVTRSVVVNADGSRTVSIESITQWTDGRKREMQQQRVIAADGSATGTGTITFTSKDGTTSTRKLSIGVSAAGDVTTESTDEATSTTVTVEENISANASAEVTATVTVQEPGQEPTAAEVSVEAVVEASMEASSEEAEAAAVTETEASSESTEASAAS